MSSVCGGPQHHLVRWQLRRSVAVTSQSHFLFAILLLTLGTSWYSDSFLACWFGCMLRTCLNILVQQPSSDLCCWQVRVQHSAPQSRTDSNVAKKKLSLVSRDSRKLQTDFIALRALQVRALMTLMSFSEVFTHDPKYLKSTTSSRSEPRMVVRGVWFWWLIVGDHLGFLGVQQQADFLQHNPNCEAIHLAGSVFTN